MDTKSQTNIGKIDPQTESAYWREQHLKQSYAGGGSYDQFEHAYRTGYNSYLKHSGKGLADVEEMVALDYQQAKPEDALPWDTVRPAVSAVWDRMAGIITPRDTDRGVRQWV